jgi:hypothetical protein
VTTNSDILVVSPCLPYLVPQERNPLLRLVLPSEQVPTEIKIPLGRVWWAESRGARLWLRGFLNVETITQESKLNDNSSRVIWHASALDSERLTWPGGGAPRSAEVADVVGREVSDNRIVVRTIPTDWSLEFCRRREVLAENAWSFELACRHYARLVQSLGLAGQTAKFAGHMDGAWAFARMNLARSELVSLHDRDAYEVAAAAIAGLAEMPMDWTLGDKTKLELETKEAMTFEPLDPKGILFIEKTWKRKGSSADSQVALERSSKRHQQILKALAESLLAKKLSPSYNRLVDAYVALPKYDILFEVKSATLENFSHQVRLAVAQLLEYRFRCKKQNGDKPIRLVAVVEDTDSKAAMSFARQFLCGLDIELVTWNSCRNIFQGLDAALC